MSDAIPDRALVVVADGHKAKLFRRTGTGAVKLHDEKDLASAGFNAETPSGSSPSDQSPKQVEEAGFANHPRPRPASDAPARQVRAPRPRRRPQHAGPPEKGPPQNRRVGRREVDSQGPDQPPPPGPGIRPGLRAPFKTSLTTDSLGGFPGDPTPILRIVVWVDTLERLLKALAIRLHAFSVCEFQQGWQLAFPAFEAITIHYVLKGSGEFRVGNGVCQAFAPEKHYRGASTPTACAWGDGGAAGWPRRGSLLDAGRRFGDVHRG